MTRSNAQKMWIVGLLLLILGTSIYVGTCSKRIDLKTALLDGSTVTVVPGVHLIGGLGPAAAYVVETSDGLLMIDTGLEDDAQVLKSEIARLGLDIRMLKAIFLTHVHGDHCGGAERLRAETGARVYAGSADVPLIVAGGPREAFFSTFKMPGHSPHPTTVDVELQVDELVSIGDAVVQTLNLPGHTAGSTCYLLERAGVRILFSGDVIYRLGDMPLGTYSTYLAPKFGGDAAAYLSSLRKLREMRAPDLVLPGHPRASRSPQSPLMTASKWDEMLERGIVEMQRLVSRFKTGGANFLDGNPKELLAELYYLGDFEGNAIYAFISDSKLFVVDAPGGAGLIEFLKKQLRFLNVNPVEPFAILLTACDERQTAGLNDLVEHTGARVYASSAGLDLIRQKCPPNWDVSSADELAANPRLALTVIPLSGPGIASVSYLLTRSGKTVLISGQLPNFIEQVSSAERTSIEGLSKHVVTQAINAIRQLSALNPDLWLPAVPIDAQNANLYDGAWNGILEKSFRAAAKVLQVP